MLRGLDMGDTTATGDEKALQGDTSDGDTSGSCREQVQRGDVQDMSLWAAFWEADPSDERLLKVAYGRLPRVTAGLEQWGGANVGLNLIYIWALI